MIRDKTAIGAINMQMAIAKRLHGRVSPNSIATRTGSPRMGPGIMATGAIVTSAIETQIRNVSGRPQMGSTITRAIGAIVRGSYNPIAFRRITGSTR